MSGRGAAMRKGYVIQLDPEPGATVGAAWGPLLCIVDEVHAWGVSCYALIPEERGKPPGQMHLRVPHANYSVIGEAEWIAGS